ncbi:hypothetical protein T439DRAFT_341664 [Meredithblackwellia eburnea MCA 4105]
MLDEYVEGLALPNQGWEDGPKALIEAAQDQEQSLEPMFSLGKVQFSLPSALFSLSCCSNILILTVIGRPAPTTRSGQPAGGGGQPPQVIRIDLDRPTEVETIDLFIPPPTLPVNSGYNQKPSTTLHKVHVDPTGRHCLVTTTTGDNYYLYIGVLPPSPSPSSQQPPQRRPKILQKLKGAIIDSVSWSTSSGTSSSASFATRDMLLGTATGQVIETSLLDPTLVEASSFSLPLGAGRAAPEKYVRLLYTLAERTPISGIKAEQWGKRGVVIISTGTRIYQLVGVAGSAGSGQSKKEENDVCVWEKLFEPYSSGDVQPKSLELPGEPPNSELHFFNPLRTDSRGVTLGLQSPKAVAWLTGPGIYHGTLSFPPSSIPLHAGEGVIESASLIPYPSEPTSPTHITSMSLSPSGHEDAEGRMEVPVSMVLTEWHFVLLYEDRIRVIGVLSDQVVWEEPLDLPPGVRPLRLSADPLRKTIWMYTNEGIYELVMKDEDRDVWKTYLGRGNWGLARRYAKNSTHRSRVLTTEASHYLTAGKFIQAAQCFAQADPRESPFEEVVLLFVDKGEQGRDALRVFLGARLERLRKTDLTQRLMLATWLVEIYLSKMNQLEDLAAAERTKGEDEAANFEIEKTLMAEDLRGFLVTYKDNLDPRTVFDLIASHGRNDLLLYFAEVVGDHERIVTHWVLEEEWTKAVTALSKQEDLELYYRFAPVLLRQSPKETVDAFKRQPSLDVRRLLPALAPPRRPTTSAKLSPPLAAATATSHQHAIHYLLFTVLDQGNTSAAVHNTLLTLYATAPTTANSESNSESTKDGSVEFASPKTSNTEADLLHFLATAPVHPTTSQPYYDLDYALRLCLKHGKVQSCVLIYSKMGLWEESVDLALESGDLELAKVCAEKPPMEMESTRKKLWLKCAKWVVGKKSDIKTAMRFLESTDLLKIEDILPFFPDFVVIDDFKDEICTALEGYSAHIERLKEDMDDATRSAEAIKSDIANLRNRFVTVDAKEKCGSCQLQLLTRQFYVFPCQHAFHADCLINEVTQHLGPASLRRMLELQAQLSPSSAPAAKSRGARATLVDDPLLQGRKLAAASVQGLDQLRKLVLPDALLGAVGVNVGRKGDRRQEQPTVRNETEEARLQSLRDQLDDLLASSCVLCERAVESIERPFVDEGEEM